MRLSEFFNSLRFFLDGWFFMVLNETTMNQLRIVRFKTLAEIASHRAAVAKQSGNLELARLEDECARDHAAAAKRLEGLSSTDEHVAVTCGG